MEDKDDKGLAEAFNILRNQGVRICPMCSKEKLSILPRYTSLNTQDDPNEIVIGQYTIPAYILICTNCGFISLHVLHLINAYKERDESD